MYGEFEDHYDNDDGDFGDYDDVKIMSTASLVLDGRTRRIAEALGIDPRNDAESVLTSRTFAE